MQIRKFERKCSEHESTSHALSFFLARLNGVENCSGKTFFQFLGKEEKVEEKSLEKAFLCLFDTFCKVIQRRCGKLSFGIPFSFSLAHFYSVNPFSEVKDLGDKDKGEPL